MDAENEENREAHPDATECIRVLKTVRSQLEAALGSSTIQDGPSAALAHDPIYTALMHVSAAIDALRVEQTEATGDPLATLRNHTQTDRPRSVSIPQVTSWARARSGQHEWAPLEPAGDSTVSSDDLSAPLELPEEIRNFIRAGRTDAPSAENDEPQGDENLPTGATAAVASAEEPSSDLDDEASVAFVLRDEAPAAAPARKTESGPQNNASAVRPRDGSDWMASAPDEEVAEAEVTIISSGQPADRDFEPSTPPRRFLKALLGRRV